MIRQRTGNPFMADHFTEIQIPQQRFYDSIPFPSVLSPTTTSAVPCSVTNFSESIKTQKPFLDSLLHETGAVLFRGFDVQTAEDFHDVVEAFGYDDFPYLGGTALRTKVFGRVFTANESPPDLNIAFHHEMCLAPEFPSKLLFFCEVEPTSGGETPIVLSHIVHEKMQQRHPEFVRKLDECGLIYSRFLKDDEDFSSPTGVSWKTTFQTEDKRVAEERAAELGHKLEWIEDGAAKRVMGPSPAIKYDESRQRKIWFNTLVGWEEAGTDPVSSVTFRDGSPLPVDICHECLKMIEDECVAIPWRKGDVLLIDNLAVLHARRPSKSPRRILASLCK